MDEPKYGTSKKCDYDVKGVPVLRIPNIGDGVIDLEDLKYAEFDEKEFQSYALELGDILIIRSNGSVSLVGKPALITEKDVHCLFAGYLINLRVLKTKVASKYILNVLTSGNLRLQIESKAKSTSGVNNINSSELSNLYMPFCSFEEQLQIVASIETRMSTCKETEEAILRVLKQADGIRQSILKQAFEGKLVVQNPNDEPASVLLKRIKEELRVKQFEQKTIKRSKSIPEIMKVQNLGIYEILKASKNGVMPIKEVWKKSRYSDEEKIEFFYEELRDEIEHKQRIKQTKVNTGEGSLLSLVL